MTLLRADCGWFVCNLEVSQKRACGKSAINTFNPAFYGIVRAAERYLDTVEAF